MNCDDFRSHLLTYVDGELAEPQVSAAAAHESQCDDCCGRVRFERAFEERIGTALLADAPERDVAELLGRIRLGAAPSPPGRVLTLRRLVATAAGLLLAVQAAWFFCIPPFECSYLQAVEAAAAPTVAPVNASETAPERLARLTVPATIGDARLDGEPVLVHLGDAGGDYAMRARYLGGEGAFTVLWCDPGGMQPSFRRRTSRAGDDWWIATENGNHLVAWMCPYTETMCTLVGEIPEETLIAAASDLRHPDR